MDSWPTLSDVHISDAKDSHPNTASAPRMQTTEPEPPFNGDQLLQMLSSTQNQMENQQTKMIRLRELAAREIEAATYVQTRLLKHIRAQRGSRSSPTAGRNVWALLLQHAYMDHSLYQKLEARLIGDLRR